MPLHAASPCSRSAAARRALLGVAKASCLALSGGCTAPGAIEEFRAAHGEFGERATWMPPVSLVGSWLPEGTIHNEPGELSFTQVVLDATAPLPRNEDEFWVVGALAGVRDVDFDGVPVLADDALHRYGLRLGYGKFLSDDLLVQGYWQPSLYSDLDGSLGSRDWRLEYGTVLAVYRTSPDWYWKAGITSNDAVDSCLIPLGGFTWHFADTWSVQVLVPRDASVVHQHGPWLLAMGLLLESDEYHVRSPSSLGLEHDVHVQELCAHVTVGRDLSSSVSFLARVGTTVAGHWDFGYGSGTDELDGTIEPDPFVALGLAYRF